MKDPRTPSTYFQQKGASNKDIQRLEGKLRDVLLDLQALRDSSNASPATKKTAGDEIRRLEGQKYEHLSREFAREAVDELMDGDMDMAIEKLKETLDFKVFRRVEPYMDMSGADIEDHVFPVY